MQLFSCILQHSLPNPKGRAPLLLLSHRLLMKERSTYHIPRKNKLTSQVSESPSQERFLQPWAHMLTAPWLKLLGNGHWKAWSKHPVHHDGKKVSGHRKELLELLSHSTSLLLLPQGTAGTWWEGGWVTEAAAGWILHCHLTSNACLPQ